MAAPPKDHNGETLPHDDQDIENHHGAIRYIDPDNHLTRDDNGNLRLSSAAFSESSTPNGGMSVDLEALMQAAGLSSTARIPNAPGWGAVRLAVGDMRAKGFQVGSDPIGPDELDGPNPYHGAVWGIGGSKKRRKALANLAVWLQKAEGVP